MICGFQRIGEIKIDPTPKNVYVSYIQQHEITLRASFYYLYKLR